MNIIFVNYQELEYLYSRDAISKLSKDPKKMYKNGLVAIFVVTFINNDYNRKVSEYTGNVDFCKSVLENPVAYSKHPDILAKSNQMVQTGLSQIFVRNPNSEDTINKIISLMRKIIEYHLKNERYLLLYDDLNDLLDVVALMNKLYQNTNPNFSSHHWFEIDIEKGLTHTFPEFITYGHLTSLWNMFVDKTNELVSQQSPVTDRRVIRLLESEQQALHFSLWIQGVTFAESYLYYIFYNVKKSNYPLNTDKAKQFIRKEKPEDDQIMKDLIFAEFDKEENREQIQVIKELHAEYKKINKVRNRLIHASAFVDQDQAHLLPLISSTTNDLINALEVSRNLVLEVEKVLPEDLKILYWWEAMEHPKFKEFEKGKFITRTDI